MTGYALVTLGDAIKEACRRCERTATLELRRGGEPAVDALGRPLRFCHKHGSSEIDRIRRLGA